MAFGGVSCDTVAREARERRGRKGWSPARKLQTRPGSGEMSGLTRDRTVERILGQGKFIFPVQADRKQVWQP